MPFEPTLPSPGVARAMELIERDAQADQRLAAPAIVRERLGLGSQRFGAALAIHAMRGGPSRWNRMIALGVDEPVDDDLLGRLVAHYAWNAGRFQVDLSPLARPAKLPDMLAAIGMRHTEDDLKWWRDDRPAAAVSSELVVRAALPDHASDIERCLDECFHPLPESHGWMAALIGRPGWSVLVALEGDHVVGTASFFARGDAAWFGIACVLPAWRRRGGQAALLAARIEAARAMGVRVMSMETADDLPDAPDGSARNAARAGFQVGWRRAVWTFQEG